MHQARVPMAPIDSNQSTFRSQPSKTQDTNYQIPFQVTKQKLSTVPDSRQENNNLYMSPRNMKLKTQTVRSPNCRSPLTTKKEIKQISSPFNFSIHSAQSPKKVESLSFLKQSECDTIKQKNCQLQKQILNLESEIQRVQSNTLMKELQQKIELLTKMNEKLNAENKDLQIRGNSSQLKKQIEQQEKTIKQYEKQLIELEQNKLQQDFSKFESDKNNNTDYITQLILDLEERVHNLIIENANLNKVFNQRIKLNERFNTLELELKQAQVQFQRCKLEEKLIKIKFNQLKKK